MFETNTPWLVRRVEKPRQWHEAGASVEALARGTFTDSETDLVSTYLVASDKQEAKVAAALMCGRDTSISTPLSLLRIPLPDVTGAGIAPLENAGDTEIPEVDRWHRDLRGPSDRFVELSECILNRIREGEDMIRDVRGLALYHRFADFCTGPLAHPRLSSQLARVKRYMEKLPR